MLKTSCIIVFSISMSVLAVLLLLPVLEPHHEEMTQDASFILREKLKQQQQQVQEQLLEDIEKYGPDLYRMFSDISQNRHQIPGSNFSADKSFKKLEVTYPDSNTYKLASAWMAYKAVVDHDIIRIRQIIDNFPENPPHQLMPNGFELEPALYAAMCNYLLHVGKFEEAERYLSVLKEKYADSLLFLPEENLISVGEWSTLLEKINSAIERFQKRDWQ